MKTGRTVIVAVLIVALLATGAMQMFVQQQRQRVASAAGGSQQGSSSLGRMDSYALALLLGGLRGPLVMFLWTQSESQKGERDLEGIDTQIEWIRLLQPEFDTVHLFQVWNKAYNLSVQMAALPNKYTTIQDALEYAYSVDRERPDNLNILSSIGQVFNDKLSTSSEKDYYRRRVRQDTAYSPARQKQTTSSGQRRTAMDMLVDAHGNLLPQYVRPRLSKPLSATSPIAQSYDGAELQALKRFQPFNYGVPAPALAYNYYKRSQLLQDLTGQRHIQMSDMVIDSRPAMALETWAGDEWERGRAAEFRAFGVKAPYERIQLELPTASLASLSADQLAAHAADLDEAIYDYDRASQVYAEAEAEFHRHISNPQYGDAADRYSWHLAHVVASRNMLAGDAAFLKSLRLTGAQRQQEQAIARKSYTEAMRAMKLIRLRYFTDGHMLATALPAGISPTDLSKMTDPQIDATTRQVEQRIRAQGYDMNAEDAAEYVTYAQRCADRLKSLH